MKNLITLLIALVCVTSLFAQNPYITETIEPVVWEELGSLPTSIVSFSEHNGRIWAANESLFYSDDDGLTWTRQETVVHQDIRQVVSLEQGVIAGRNRVHQTYPPYSNLDLIDLFRSVDAGATFSDTLESIIVSQYHFGEHYSPGIFKKSDSELMKIEGETGGFAKSSYSFSSDGGLTWQKIEEFQFETLIAFTSSCRCTTNDNTLQLALPFGTDSLKFKTYAAGTYEADSIEIILPTGFTGDYAYFKDGRIFLAQDNKLTYSDDLGGTWILEEYDMPGEIITDNYYFGERSIVRTTDAGVWEIDYADLTTANLLFIPKFGRPGFVSVTSNFNYAEHYPYFEAENADFFSDQSGVYRRGLGESEFTIVANGLSKDADGIRVFGDVLWAHRAGILYTSADAGDTWHLRTDEELFFNSGSIAGLLGSQTGNMFIKSSGGIYKGANNGEMTEWTLLSDITGNKGLETTAGLFIYDNDNLFHTIDGENFITRNLPAVGGSYVYFNEELLCFNSGNRHASSDFGETWTTTQYAGSYFYSPMSLDNSLVSVGNGTSYFYEPESSIDGGNSWFPLRELFANGGYVNYTSYAKYHGKAANMVFYSAGRDFVVTGNEGADWYIVDVPFSYYESYTFLNFGYAFNEIPGPKGIVGTGDYIIAYSTDQGIYRTPYAGIKDQIDTSFQERSIVTGRMYKDWNDNCIYDDGDTPIAGKVISIGEEHGYTNDAGLYAVYFPPSLNGYTYETAAVLYQEMNCNNGLTGSIFSDIMDTDTIDIPFHPIAGISDVEVSIFSSYNFRPGQEAVLGVRVKNVGNTNLDELLSINYDPEVQTFVSASVGGVDVEAGLITFPINLNVEESSIHYFRLLNSEDLNIGEMLSHTATVENSDDETPENNTDTYTVEVTSSYDPNDKTVWSNGEILPENANELTYRLRFQNTGTDTAFKVIVIDTLPAQLDLLTFEMLDASHDYELRFSNPGILEWTFDNILLPDSTTNEPASHGYILFKIKTLADVVDGDELPNDVAIYFDFNEPVFTNEVVTIVEKGKVEYHDIYEICEGEEWNEMIITESFTIIDTAYGTVYDTIYTAEVIALPTYENEFNITGGTGTIVEGEVMTADAQLSGMYLSQSGCDSLVTYNFMLQQIEINQEIEVCEGDMWNEMPVFDDMIFSDTIYNPLADTIINSQISILPTYSNELAFGVSVGTNVNGTEVYSDTTFTLNFETWQGCDSLITYTIDVISAVELIDNQLFSAKLFPNPATRKATVTIQSDKSYLLNAAVLSLKGELLFEPLKDMRVAENEYTFDLEMANLPAGVYYLRLEAEGELQYLKIVKVN